MTDKISIHAPREGSDPGAAAPPGWQYNFYPRSPRGERPDDEGVNEKGYNFYPRSPRGERRLAKQRMAGQVWHFYPRSPRGERPELRLFVPGVRSDFYPRSPRGERQPPAECPRAGHDISIHAPREGSDVVPAAGLPDEGHFYPRSPRGERLSVLHRKLCSRLFLSTLPARGATQPAVQGLCAYLISIHAPREGSDTVTTRCNSWTTPYFYPRSPRGERPKTSSSSSVPWQYFYPRSPRGERHSLPFRAYARI